MWRIESLEARCLLAGAGQLDLGFGTSGVVTVDFAGAVPSGFQTGVAQIAEDRNGFIYAAGLGVSLTDPTNRQLLVARYTPTGQIDSRFGVGGIATLPRISSTEPEMAINPKTGGLFLRDGTRLYSLNSRGKWDRAFGKKGKQTIPVLASIDTIDVDANGLVYASGTSGPEQDRQSTLIRLTASGARDQSFGSGGIFTRDHIAPADVTSHPAPITKLRVLGDGDIMLVATESYRSFDPDLLSTVNTTDFLSTRLNRDGSIDSAYGANGISTLHQPDSDVRFFSLGLLSIEGDGRVIGTRGSTDDSETGNPLSNNFLITPEGSITEPFDPVPDSITDDPSQAVGALAFQSDGKTIASFSNKLIRTNSDGELDTTWGDNGISPFGSFTSTPMLARDGSLFVFERSFNDVPSKIRRLWRDDAPLARATAINVTRTIAASILIDVHWRAAAGISSLDFDSADLFVQFPDGVRRGVRFISAEQLVNASWVATYKLSSPDGIWNANDNGQYIIRARGGAVTSAGAGNIPRAIGSFVVNVS